MSRGLADRVGVEALATPSGHVRRWRCAAVMTAVFGAAYALVSNDSASALQFAFSGRVPVAVGAEEIEVSGMSITPGLSSGKHPDAALLSVFEGFEARGVCVTSTVELPVIGAATARLYADTLSGSKFTIEASSLTSSGVSLSSAGMSTDPSGRGASAPFRLSAGSFEAADVRVEPRTFTAATLAAKGFHADFVHGRQGCPSPAEGSENGKD
ncbi:DUF6230 family protein [Streptomyces sp. NPDC023588]|uniref:DUF6230 family protein n=1 Tax=Streptomyces sp. NPDC023588 TaxID=3154907 RepID=UPI00340D248C